MLAARHAEGKLLVLDALTLPEAKTKRMVECLDGLGVEGSTLVVLGTRDEAVQRAARNLPRVKVLVADGLNVYDVLAYANLVLTRDAMERLVARLAGNAPDDAKAGE